MELSIRLHCTLNVRTQDKATAAHVTRLLGLEPLDDDSWWGHMITTRDLNSGPQIVESFLDVLEKHFDELASIGVARSQIHIKFDYAYPDGFVAQLPAELLGRLGRDGIALAYTAWEEWDDEEPDTLCESATS